MKTIPYDVVIIGGGPIGLACGLAAKQSGLHYCILEKGALVNSIYHYPANMTFFSTSERLEIGGIPFVSNNAKPTRNEALEYYRRVAVAAALDIHLFEKVLDISKQDNTFTVHSNKTNYLASNLIVATGFYDIPYLLGVAGEQLDKVRHYYQDPHFYAFQKVLVVGAANSAVDAALETWRKGAVVTMVIRGDQISDRVKYWVKPDIENRIAEGSIKAFFNSTVAAIRPDEVDIATPEGLVTVPNDWVLSMTGYQPDLAFLSKLGIELSADEVCKPSYSEDNFETNIPGIYLAGVICGGMNTHRLFIENSREHALKIISDITQKKKGSA